MPALDGLIDLPATPAAVLNFTGLKDDPVARASVRLRLVRTAVAKNPDLAVRIGGRLFILDQEAKLRQLAQALGLSVPAPAPKPARARRASSSSMGAAAAA